MYNEALQEILTKIEERAPEVRAFCPYCAKMTQLELIENVGSLAHDFKPSTYRCYLCTRLMNAGSQLLEYNKMRFEHVTT